MKDKVNVLIVGANFINKGAEAMLKTVQQELGRKYSNANFYMISRDKEENLAKENNFIPVFDESSALKKSIDTFKWRAKGKLHKIIFGKNQPYVFPFPFKEITKKLNTLDVVVDISGFAYADSWGKPMIAETTKLIKLCKKHFNAKFYFFPQAWGSFDNPVVADAAREMLQLADHFYARDVVSQAFLAKVLGKEAHEIPLLHDIAFSYEGSKTIQPQKLLKSIGYSKSGRKLIGISPNMRVYEKLEGSGKENKYIQILLALSQYCMHTLNADILLVPNEIIPDTFSEKERANDDRRICQMLNEMINDPERCYLVDKYRSSEEIMAFVSQVDLLVSSRFHALIFGLHHAIPVMAISWSHKYKELFSLFGLDEFVLEWDAMNEDSAIALLKKLDVRQEEIRKKISAELPQLKSKADEMFTKLAANH